MLEQSEIVYGLREPTEGRFKTSYDGTWFDKVRNVKLVERFVEQGEDGYSYKLVAALFKVKAPNLKFYILADLDEDEHGLFWFIDLSMLNTTVDEVMIIQDYIRHELEHLSPNKVRIEVKEPEFDSQVAE